MSASDWIAIAALLVSAVTAYWTYRVHYRAQRLLAEEMRADGLRRITAIGVRLEDAAHRAEVLRDLPQHPEWTALYSQIGTETAEEKAAFLNAELKKVQEVQELFESSGTIADLVRFRNLVGKIAASEERANAILKRADIFFEHYQWLYSRHFGKLMERNEAKGTTTADDSSARTVAPDPPTIPKL